jgi:hypothetical protein
MFHAVYDPIFRIKCSPYVGFEVLTAMSTKMAVLWIVAPCSLVEVYQRFRGPCCLHHQGDSPCVSTVKLFEAISDSKSFKAL